MKTLNIFSLLDGGKPKDKNGEFFVIGVRDFDVEDYPETYDDGDSYESCSLETLIENRKDIKIVKRFKEVHNPKYLGDEFGTHILQPALVAFKKVK
jgi:hypothetical protein